MLIFFIKNDALLCPLSPPSQLHRSFPQPPDSGHCAVQGTPEVYSFVSSLFSPQSYSHFQVVELWSVGLC